MRTDIDAKRALVTGASSGIGAEIAKALCNADVQVLAVARNQGRLEQVRAELPKNKQKYFVSVAGDLRKKSDVEKIAATALKTGVIDLLVNNAGVGYNKNFADMSDQEIEDIVGTNLLGHLYLTRAVLRARKPDDRLHIVFVTSLAGKIGFGGLSVYSATKFAIEGFVEALRLEYKGTPVSFTIVRPGVTDTGFFDKAGMQEFHSSVKGTKTLHPPKEVADQLLASLNSRPAEIIVGNDKYFLKILPFIPFDQRFKVLNITNKL